MVYQWRKPDQTQALIDSAVPISEVLDALHSQWRAARDGGNRKAEASLWASYLLQKREWLRCQRAVCERELTALDEIIDVAVTREAWWSEVSRRERPVRGLSPAQAAIFATCDAAAKPQSWEQAALALNQLVEFRIPAPDQMERALQANRKLLSQAAVFRTALSAMIEVLAKSNPTESAWKELQQLGSAYDQAVRDAALA